MSDTEMEVAGKVILPATADKEDNLQYDLGNLMAFDPAIDTSDFKKNVNESLRALARDNAQLLINRIFELPSEPGPSNIGRVAALPKPTSQLPREKPVPKPKELTTWEKFAKSKGIVKTKKSRMEYDEKTGEYVPRFGYKRAAGEMSEYAIEAKPGEDASVDPWTRMESEKKERVNKNKKQQLANVKAASGERVPGTLDLSSIKPSSGKPVHSKGKKQAQEVKAAKTGHVETALAVVQKSTASMGQFDKVRPLEPERKLAKTSTKESTRFKNAGDEKSQSMAVLKSILGKDEGQGFDRERAANMVQRERESGNREAKKSDKGGKGKSNKGSKGSSKGSSKGASKKGFGSKKGGGGASKKGKGKK